MANLLAISHGRRVATLGKSLLLHAEIAAMYQINCVTHCDLPALCTILCPLWGIIASNFPPGHPHRSPLLLFLRTGANSSISRGVKLTFPPHRPQLQRKHCLGTVAKVTTGPCKPADLIPTRQNVEVKDWQKTPVVLLRDYVADRVPARPGRDPKLFANGILIVLSIVWMYGLPLVSFLFPSVPTLPDIWYVYPILLFLLQLGHILPWVPGGYLRITGVLGLITFPFVMYNRYCEWKISARIKREGYC